MSKFDGVDFLRRLRLIGSSRVRRSSISIILMVECSKPCGSMLMHFSVASNPWGDFFFFRLQQLVDNLAYLIVFVMVVVFDFKDYVVFFDVL